ncbi:MAG: TOBE domain-containing protein [Sulfurimonas sp.]|nr:TOBE domain-containing protein [Sulfurimonas sp.]
MIKKLLAIVTRVQTLENLNIVSFDIEGQTLRMMSLDLSDNIKIGCSVWLNIKATSVAIAKNFQGELSYSNQLHSSIVTIENGALLSSIVLSIGEVNIESIITLESSQRMNLKVGDEVLALIKANEISISEIF